MLARCYKRYCDFVVGSVCTKLAEGNGHSLEYCSSTFDCYKKTWRAMNFIKCQAYFTGAIHIVFNSVFSIDTNYICVMSQRTEKVQNLCKLEGLSDWSKPFAIKCNGSS